MRLSAVGKPLRIILSSPMPSTPSYLRTPCCRQALPNCFGMPTTPHVLHASQTATQSSRPLAVLQEPTGSKSCVARTTGSGSPFHGRNSALPLLSLKPPVAGQRKTAQAHSRRRHSRRKRRHPSRSANASSRNPSSTHSPTTASWMRTPSRKPCVRASVALWKTNKVSLDLSRIGIVAVSVQKRTAARARLRLSDGRRVRMGGSILSLRIVRRPLRGGLRRRRCRWVGRRRGRLGRRGRLCLRKG